MSKQGSVNPSDAPETTAESQNTAINTDSTKEDSEIQYEDWPKGLYMIFAAGADTTMGKVIGLTKTTARIHPWDFMFGGVDEDQIKDVVLAHVEQFVSFDDIWDMDEYNEKHFWLKNNKESK